MILPTAPHWESGRVNCGPFTRVTLSSPVALTCRRETRRSKKAGPMQLPSVLHFSPTPICLDACVLTRPSTSQTRQPFTPQEPKAIPTIPPSPLKARALSLDQHFPAHQPIRAESSRQEFLDLDGDLVSLNLNSLAVEMDVVAVVFRMASHRRV